MATYRLHCRVSPYDYDAQWAAFFDKNNLVPEIYLNKHALDGKIEAALDKMAAWLDQKKIRPSMHAPFASNDPVLFDSIARNHAEKVTDKTIALVRRFNAEIVVCHPVFEKYRNRKSYSKWIDENVRYFDHMVAQTRKSGTIVAVENIFEDGPDFIHDILSEVRSERLKFCLDVGHYNKYSKANLAKWFKVLGDKLCEIHVHDNSGKHDEHLPPGEGLFPFPKLAVMLQSLDKDLIMTLEPLNREAALRAVKNARRLFGIK